MYGDFYSNNVVIDIQDLKNFAAEKASTLSATPVKVKEVVINISEITEKDYKFNVKDR